MMRLHPMIRMIRSAFPALALPFLALCLLAAGLTGCVGDLSNDMARLNGYRAMRKGDHEQARKHFQRCVERNPTDWKSLYYLGRMELKEFNNADEARRHLEIAYSVRENRSDIQLSVAPGSSKTAVPFPSRTEILAALAEAMHQQGNAQELFSFLRNEIENHGTKKDYLLLAEYLEKNGDHDAALVAYEQAAKAAGAGDASGYIALAGFYDRIGQPDRALTALRKAYHIDPSARGLEQKIRDHGMVPGPTIALPPDGQTDQPGAGTGGADPKSAESTEEQS